MNFCTCKHIDTGHSANGPSGAYVGKNKGRCMYCSCDGFRPSAPAAQTAGFFGSVAACAVLALLLSGCPRPLPGPVPPSDGDAAAPARADGPATCARLCADGRGLGCDWARPTPRGAPCEDVCTNATSGGPLAWDLGCRVGNLELGRGCPSVDLCP